MPSIVSTTNAQTLAVTIPATTAHNCLIVCIGAASGNGTAPTVTGVTLGGAAGNFAALVTKTATNGISAADGAFIWADPDCAGGQTSVAISGTNLNVAAATGGVTVYEVAGLPLSAVLDKSSGGSSGTNVTTWTSGATATTTQASEFWVGCVVGGGTVAAPGAPWNDSLAGFTHMAAGTQIVSATGAATYNSTQTSAIYSAVVATLFSSASTSGTVQPVTARPAPRRRRARARVLSLPVAGVNAAPAPPVSGTVQPVTARPAPRRRRARARVLSLPVAGVNAVQTRTLLISLASAAGTDDYGNAYPQGIFASAGVIQGPTFVGSDYLSNTAGSFYYSGAPAFGNLISSVAPSAGTDAQGNAYLAGTVSYLPGGTFSAVAITGGAVAWFTASGAAGPWTEVGVMEIALTGGNPLVFSFSSLGGNIEIPQPAIFGLPLASPAPSSYNVVWGTQVVNAINNLYSMLQAAGISF